MSKYEKLKKKYAELIPQELEKNKTILIESFVEYYGENYRSIIQKRYNEITFVYYIDWETVNVIVNDFIPKVENKERYQDFVRFFDDHRKKDNFWKKLCKRNTSQSDLPDNLIGITNKEILNKGEIKSRVLKAIKGPQPSSDGYGSSKHMDRIVSFQILSLGPESIVHEINHAITGDALALVVDNNQFIGTISKTGLSIDVCSQNKGERCIEELLNEKASFDITQIFKRRGGDLSSLCLGVPLFYPYEENFYLVNKFYEQFKDYIKVARISENKNELVSRVGRKEYEKYVDLINAYYSEDSSTIKENKGKALPIVESLVDQMRIESQGDSYLSSDDINTYYEQLIQNGYNVRGLNNEENDINSIKRK